MALNLGWMICLVVWQSVDGWDLFRSDSLHGWGLNFIPCFFCRVKRRLDSSSSVRHCQGFEEILPDAVGRRQFSKYPNMLLVPPINALPVWDLIPPFLKLLAILIPTRLAVVRSSTSTTQEQSLFLLNPSDAMLI